MASTQQASSELKPLRSSIASLEQRWPELSKIFQTSLTLSSTEVFVSADVQASSIWAGLAGRSCERINRNRGSDTFVAPLLTMRNSALYWVGLQEVWNINVGPKPGIFRQLGLTVHLGFRGDPVKPQVFRAEWAGVQDWTGEGINFRPRDAGHPHWQIDLLETLRSPIAAAEFDPDQETITEDFGVVSAEPTIEAIARSTPFENMHFASAAPWWTKNEGANPVHANPPESLQDLTRWLKNCLEYVKQELARC